MRLGFGIGINFPPSTTPVNTLAPVISGTPEQGETLTATPGTWTDAGTISTQWLRNGTAISGENGLTYIVGALTAGDTIEYQEETEGVIALSNALSFVAPPVIKAFDLTSDRKMLYAFEPSQVEGLSNDGFAAFADFTYDGGSDRMVFGFDVDEAFTIAMHDGQVRISDFSAFQLGSTTGIAAGRYLLGVRYDGTTLRAWIREQTSGTTSLEIDVNVNFTTDRPTDAQIGGAFENTTDSGLSRDPLNGKIYAAAFWGSEPTEAQIIDLVDGNTVIEDLTSNVPLWWPDPSLQGRDRGTGALTVKTFGETRQLTGPAEVDNSRVMRDPETGIPVQYDDGGGARYWMAFNTFAYDLRLASSTDLETWVDEGQLFSGEGGDLRASDLLYLGNISGSHDPFLLLTVSSVSGESMLHARTSSDLSTWTSPTIDAANAIFRDTAINANGIEDFTVCRFDGAWYATYEQDQMQNGTVAVGLAKSTSALPSTGWAVVNSRAFPTPDLGFNTSDKFVANPACAVMDGEFYIFYEGADFTTSSRTLPLTLMRKSATPEIDTSWEEHGVVFYSLGRRCFPNCVTVEGGVLSIYMQNGLTDVSTGGGVIGKVEYDDLSFLLVD